MDDKATQHSIERRGQIEEQSQESDARGKAELLEGPEDVGSNVGTSTDTSTDLGVEHVALGVKVESSAGKGVQWFADGIGTRDDSTVLDVGVLARTLKELELCRFFEGQRFNSGGSGLEVQRAKKASDLRSTFREELGRDAIGSASGRGPEGQAIFLGVKERGQVFEELIKTRSGTTSSDEFDGGRVITDGLAQVRVYAGSAV